MREPGQHLMDIGIHGLHLDRAIRSQSQGCIRSLSYPARAPGRGMSFYKRALAVYGDDD
jgi:hypothetical protein